MAEDAELDLLLSLDGASFEMAEGYVVEFRARRTKPSTARPHGLVYAFVLRPLRGAPIVRFDNAHAVDRSGGRYVKRATAHDHWHKTTDDPGRPYEFTTASRLLDDFWREVKRALDEKGIPNDL